MQYSSFITRTASINTAKIFFLAWVILDSVEKLLSINPNSKIIIAGDVNQLDIKTLKNHLSPAQLVKSPTRGQKILDVFLTKCTTFLEENKCGKNIGEI